MPDSTAKRRRRQRCSNSCCRRTPSLRYRRRCTRWNSRSRPAERLATAAADRVDTRTAARHGQRYVTADRCQFCIASCRTAGAVLGYAAPRDQCGELWQRASCHIDHVAGRRCGVGRSDRDKAEGRSFVAARRCGNGVARGAAGLLIAAAQARAGGAIAGSEGRQHARSGAAVVRARRKTGIADRKSRAGISAGDTDDHRVDGGAGGLRILGAGRIELGCAVNQKDRIHDLALWVIMPVVVVFVCLLLHLDGNAVGLGPTSSINLRPTGDR